MASRAERGECSALHDGVVGAHRAGALQAQRVEDLGESPFSLRSYGFGELAQMYYPDRNERSAIRLFREEMHLTRGLWDAMVAVGYKPYTKVLTRGQVKTIVRFLGEP